MNPQSEKELSRELYDLSFDMQRMLKIQLKEFIYLIEDGEISEVLKKDQSSEFVDHTQKAA
ncbi:MAG: hypothetical protein K2W82_09680 [Candidatus Obscuribacterales bacterium]|nr:hypothetical protein [Candidatus Obscuribacterales bacterium]